VKDTKAAQRWTAHDRQWRSPAAVTTLWPGADAVDPELLRHRVRGQWWQTLERLQITLIVSREYEHLLMAMSTSAAGRPRISFMPLPHPSGIAVDRRSNRVHVASTRNPNQIFTLRPAVGAADGDEGETLLPSRSEVLPGKLYLHDLAFIDGALYGAAAGINAVVRLDGEAAEPVWWPRAVDTAAGPAFERNYLQLNSIAAGPDLRSSFFSASCDQMSTRRPGHRNFAVDGRGVLFSGRTREPVVRGLTRPHSARLDRGRLWVNNSGYGEVGYGDGGGFAAVQRLPGWTRGLALCQDVAFVGTSRVIPRYRHYAPGLEVADSICGVHALDAASGQVLGSLIWPSGNQIFGIEWLPRSVAAGLAFAAGRRTGRRELQRFYSFSFAEMPRRRTAA
jgi:uncharacterized protein (TIGR03032 family)